MNRHDFVSLCLNNYFITEKLTSGSCEMRFNVEQLQEVASAKATPWAQPRPTLFKTNDGYIIIGKKATISGLANQVGEDEELVFIPTVLLNNINS